ncbi:MAG: 3-hydroxyacyl-CoA dehydrogenase NAD-binding domain-containing protein [Peptostreptococcales bacterium]
MEKVMVVGAGTMGFGIAQTFLQSGYQVILYDIDTPKVDKGISNIESNIQKMLQKGDISADQYEEIRARLKGTIELADAKDVDLVVETVIENSDIKKDIFKKLDRICQPDTILATNTSSIVISSIAAATKRPENVIGMHFFNPPPMMPLIEIVIGMKTSEKTLATMKAIVQSLGKESVTVKDSPGFVFNRIMIPMINEATYLLSESVASAEDIDKTLKLAATHQIGPLALGDFIGLDVCLHVMEVLHKEIGEDKYRPSPLLKRMVAANQLGRKTGEGFFKY